MTLEIITAANESYRRMLGAMMASLVATHRDRLAEIRLTLLDNGLLPHTGWRLRRWAGRQGLALKMVRVTPELFRAVLGPEAKVPPQFPYYARLLGPHVVARRSARALYVDADILVTGSVLDGAELDLRGRVVGCCEEPGIRRFDCPERGIRNYATLGLPGDAPYFNSGVLLIDVARWVEERVSERVLGVTHDHPEHVHAWDQYGLNVVLHGRWLPLDRAWNETERLRAGETRIRHFAWKKPVVRGHDVPDRDLFFRRLDESPWNGWRPRRPKSRIRRRVEEALIGYVARRAS